MRRVNNFSYKNIYILIIYKFSKNFGRIPVKSNDSLFHEIASIWEAIAGRSCRIFSQVVKYAHTCVCHLLLLLTSCELGF